MNKKIIIIIIILLSVVFYKIIYYRLIFNSSKSDDIAYIDWFNKIKWLAIDTNNFNKYVIDTDLIVYYLHNPATHKYSMYMADIGSNLSTNYEQIDFLYNYSSVIFFDYRSNDNRLIMINSMDSFKKDCKTVWNWLTNDIGLIPDDIIIVAHGLAAMFAMYLNTKISESFDTNAYPHAIVLISPCFDIKSYVKHYKVDTIWIDGFKWLISNFIPSTDCDEYIERCNCSVPFIINCDAYYESTANVTKLLDQREIPYIVYKLSDTTFTKYVRFDQDFVYKMTTIFDCN